jgi:NAD-dependent deacetylase
MSTPPPAPPRGAPGDPARARPAAEQGLPVDPSLPRPLDEAISAAAAMLRASEVVTVLTGAGVSAESGIPTFRDATAGWWARHRAEDLATPQAFAANPALVWSWYASRRAMVRSARPNPAHEAITWLARRSPRCTVLTQNVDGLHEASGLDDVLRLHGSLRHVRCSAGCSPAFEAPPAMDDAGTPEALVSPPPCARCGAPLRPDVVWFGERLRAEVLERARAATFACDVFLSVGTSNLVEPAASLPWLAAAHGATVLVVNPTLEGQRRGPSIMPLRGSAAAILPRLVARAWPARRGAATARAAEDGTGDDGP